MILFRPSVPSFVAAAALLATTACSGGGAPGAALSADAIPLAAARAPVAAGSADAAPSVAIAPLGLAPDAAAAEQSVLAPDDVAALAAPAAAPASDAAATDGSEVLDGKYVGTIIENIEGGGFHRGTLTIWIQRYGTNVYGAAHVNGEGKFFEFTLTGTAKSQKNGSTTLELTATPEGNGCSVSGPAKREGASLFGKFISAGCAQNLNYFYKAYPA